MALRKRILDLVSKHDSWRSKECVNLIPSENVMSPTVRQLFMSDMGNRYTLPMKTVVYGEQVENVYRGTRYIDELETTAEKLACEVFRTRHASLRPLSGHVATMIMLIALCRAGDTIVTVPEEIGGYNGYLPDYVPSFMGLRSLVLPHKGFELDYEASVKLILKEKPKLLILGASLITFPFNIKALKRACDDVGARIGYDASHVLGLIAGGKFQQPLEEGADIMVASTHKSFFGPQGGIVLTNDDDVYQKVLDSLTWKTLDNAHWNRIAAMSYALIEFREVGREYAAQVVKNSKALAKALESKGIPVMFKGRGYTESHQVLMETQAVRRQSGLSYAKIAERLEKAGIIVDCVGRLGTQEMTRYGMKENEMRRIADLISRVVGGEGPDSVKKDVLNLRSAFPIVGYTLDSDSRVQLK